MNWSPVEQMGLIAVALRAITAAITEDPERMREALDPVETLSDAIYVVMQLVGYSLPIVRLQTETPTGPVQLLELSTKVQGVPQVDSDTVALNDLWCTVLGYLSTKDWDAAATAIAQAERLAYPLMEFSALMLSYQAAGRMSCTWHPAT